MTLTKRKRIYIELGRPLPGDIVMFRGGWLWQLPPTDPASKWQPSMHLQATCTGMVIALDGWLECAMVMVHKTEQDSMKFGWSRIDNMVKINASTRS